MKPWQKLSLRGLACLALLPGLAQAEARKLSGAEIVKLLSGHTLVNPPDQGPSQQSFAADGTTLYQAPDKSLKGRWKVVGDAYCSTWDENSPPKCASVFFDPPTVMFTGADGAKSVLILAK